MLLGNDCILIWLGNDKDESVYSRAKQRIKPDRPHCEKEFRKALEEEYEKEIKIIEARYKQ